MLKPDADAAARHSGLTARELACEYGINPLGLDVTRPRFTWVLQAARRGQVQSACQVLVASRADKLDADIGDKWDSGKTPTDHSVNVEYGGTPLVSRETCYWKVRCWDADGNVGPYSAPATFEMGLLEPGDWQADWIGADRDVPAPLLRKAFSIERQITRARIYLSGLGWNELYVNGHKVGNRALDPAVTDYDKHVLYVTWDVTALLEPGRNVLGIILGHGWYSQPRVADFADVIRQYGDSPRLLLQMHLTCADGSSAIIKSDETWRVSDGPITCNGIVNGEVYDARLEKPGWNRPGYDDTNWPTAQLKTPPRGRLEAQSIPPIRVMGTIKPIERTEPKPNVYVFDMGQLFGGWVRLKVRGPRGTKVRIKYGEYLFWDARWIDDSPYPGLMETDFYILKGEGEEVFEPRFTFHPVRYVQIEGYPGVPALDDIEARLVYTETDMTSDFDCSDPLLNRIHENCTWTMTNEAYSLPLDCFHREQCSYIGAHPTVYTRKYRPRFWIKWLRDVKVSLKDGMLPDQVAIGRAYYPGNPTVTGYLFLVWYLYQECEDTRLLEEHYPCMRAWMEYQTSIAQDYLITQGLFGDHMEPGRYPGEELWSSVDTPPPLVWTCYFHRGAVVLSRIAALLGRSDDAQRYSRLAEDIKDAVNREWFDSRTGQYATGTQSANLLPLTMGIVPEDREQAVFDNIVEDIMVRHAGHLHTGSEGTTALVEALTPFGRPDVMYAIASARTYPGWGYMIERGATTIWEAWGRHWQANRKRADSMTMWLAVERFFHNDLAGIGGPAYRGADVAPGYRRILIKPHVVGDLTHASASVRTVRGVIHSHWQREDDSLTLRVTIPVNSRAQVNVPKLGHEHVTVSEGDAPVWRAGRFVAGVDGIAAGHDGSTHVTFDVGSGDFVFRLTKDTSEDVTKRGQAPGNTAPGLGKSPHSPGAAALSCAVWMRGR